MVQNYRLRTHMKKDDLLKVGGVNLDELANLQNEIKKAIKDTKEEDRASVIAMNASKWESYLKESTKLQKICNPNSISYSKT